MGRPTTNIQSNITGTISADILPDIYSPEIVAWPEVLKTKPSEPKVITPQKKPKVTLKPKKEKVSADLEAYVPPKESTVTEFASTIAQQVDPYLSELLKQPHELTELENKKRQALENILKEREQLQNTIIDNLKKLGEHMSKITEQMSKITEEPVPKAPTELEATLPKEPILAVFKALAPIVIGMASLFHPGRYNQNLMLFNTMYDALRKFDLERYTRALEEWKRNTEIAIMEKQNRLQALQLKREEIKDKMALLGETGKWLDEGIKLRANLLQAEINTIVNARNQVYDAIDKLEKRMIEIQKLKADIEHKKAQEKHWEESREIAKERLRRERPTTLQREFEYFKLIMKDSELGKKLSERQLFELFMQLKKLGFISELPEMPELSPSPSPSPSTKEKIRTGLGYGNK
jgi:hypothetical protein